MKTKVSICGVEFFAYHGYYEEEQKAGNVFLVDASVELKSFDSTEDNIEDTVNYEKLFKICSEEMGNTQKLIETVALQIITRLKNDLSNVTAGYIKIEKIRPQLGGKVEKAVIEMSF